jgi:Txe/YoeB family toxin of Txe-Axe toxin-antitoxin module
MIIKQDLSQKGRDLLKDLKLDLLPIDKQCEQLLLLYIGVCSERLEKVFSEIMSCRNHSLARFLIMTVCEEMRDDPTFLERFEALSNQTKKLNVCLILPMILIIKWTKEATPEDAFVFRAILEPFKKDLKDQEKPLLESILLTMKDLDGETSLSPQRKLALLRQAFSGKVEKEEILKRLSFLQSLSERETVRELDKDFSENMTEELTKIFEDSIKRDPFIDLERVEGLNDKYQGTLGSMRVSNGWKIYAKGLKSLGDQKIQKEFNRFILSVLEGVHKEGRYKTDNSRHLKMIQKQFGDRFKSCD